MKKFVKYFFLFFSLSLATQAQNLVPNYSFEQYDTCPDNQDQIQRATGWSKYSYLGSTPDYYNACDTGGQWSVPNGFLVHQSAQDGNAYGAVVTFVNITPTYREHIGIQLIQPLIIGEKYFFSLHATMGGGHLSSTPSNNIGMRLSTIAYNSSTPSPIDNFAHLYSVSIISDTVNWIQIAGSIIADSAYNYCIIGNFFDNINTDTIRWNTNSTFSYYAVDVICISSDSLTCNPNPEGVSSYNKENSLAIYPNPSSGLFFIDVPINAPYELLVCDALSRTIVRRTIYERITKMNLEGCSNGLYFVTLKSKDKFYSKKIIKY